MRLQEAQQLFQHIKKHFAAGQRRICLNLGSSTLNSRTKRKPWITTELLEPLANLGFKVVHSDIKNDYGVDIVGDIADPQTRDRLKWCRADLILCNNLLEHVEHVPDTIEHLQYICKPNTVIAVTVPQSYPYHPDPIDNNFRPTEAQLHLAFDNFQLLSTDTVTAGNLWQDLGYNTLSRLCGVIKYKFDTVWAKPSIDWYKERIHRMCWLFKNYKVTLCLFQTINKDKQ